MAGGNSDHLTSPLSGRHAKRTLPTSSVSPATLADPFGSSTITDQNTTGMSSIREEEDFEIVSVIFTSESKNRAKVPRELTDSTPTKKGEYGNTFNLPVAAPRVASAPELRGAFVKYQPACGPVGEGVNEHKKKDKDNSSAPMPPFPKKTYAAAANEAAADQHFQQRPETATLPPPVWRQSRSAGSFKRRTAGVESGFEVAYHGALETLSGVNPELFKMPWGARVVSIKTEFPSNIIWSLRQSTWLVAQKVADRIMKLWSERDSRDDQVFFLFSVNNSKRYCGVAEMTGSWTKGGNMEGWESNTDDDLGWIPITWRYVKNVDYSLFKDLKHDNNQPIVNMWNGMHFPSNIGRKVMEIYVTAPHTENMLCWPNTGDRNGKYASNTKGLRRRDAESARPVKIGQSTQVGSSTQMDQHAASNQGVHASFLPEQLAVSKASPDADGDKTPAAPKRQPATIQPDKPLGKLAEAALSSNHVLRVGEKLAFVVNANGELVPVTPVGTPTTSTGAAIRSNQPSHFSTNDSGLQSKKGLTFDGPGYRVRRNVPTLSVQGNVSEDSSIKDQTPRPAPISVMPNHPRRTIAPDDVLTHTPTLASMHPPNTVPHTSVGRFGSQLHASNVGSAAQQLPGPPPGFGQSQPFSMQAPNHGHPSTPSDAMLMTPDFFHQLNLQKQLLDAQLERYRQLSQAATRAINAYAMQPSSGMASTSGIPPSSGLTPSSRTSNAFSHFQSANGRVIHSYPRAINPMCRPATTNTTAAAPLGDRLSGTTAATAAIGSTPSRGLRHLDHVSTTATTAGSPRRNPSPPATPTNPTFPPM